MVYFVLYDNDGAILGNIIADSVVFSDDTYDFYDSNDNMICFFYSHLVSKFERRFLDA